LAWQCPPPDAKLHVLSNFRRNGNILLWLLSNAQASRINQFVLGPRAPTEDAPFRFYLSSFTRFAVSLLRQSDIRYRFLQSINWLSHPYPVPVWSAAKINRSGTCPESAIARCPPTGRCIYFIFADTQFHFPARKSIRGKTERNEDNILVVYRWFTSRISKRWGRIPPALETRQEEAVGSRNR